jgi:hypothetical protein
MTIVAGTGDVELAGPRRGRLWPVVRVAIGLTLSALGLWLAVRGVRLSAVQAVLSQVRPVPLLAAVAVDLAIVWAMAARWRRLFVPPLPRLGWLFELFTIAQLTNAVVPGRPGALVRAYLAGKGRPGGTAEVLTTIVGEKLVESLSLYLLAVLILSFVPLDGRLRLVAGLGAGLLVAAMGVLAWLAGREEAAGQRLDLLLGRWPRLLGLAQGALSGVGVWRQRRAIVAVWAWTAAILALAVLRGQLLLWSLDIHVPATAPFVILVLTLLGNWLAAAPAGLGVMHYAAVLALSLYGVNQAVALGYAIVYHLVIYLPSSLLGVYFLARSGYSLRRLTQSAGESRPPRSQ